MHKRLALILTTLAVVIGSLSQVALASPRLPARPASAAHAQAAASVVTHSATPTIRSAAARHRTAHRARMRTEGRQGSQPLRTRPRVTVPSALVPPAFTSDDHTTLTVGTAGTFNVTSTGTPTAQLFCAGALPSGVTCVPGILNGRATLSGTPAAGTGGTYALTITAVNLVNPSATQHFTLTVDEAPKITSAAAATFTADQRPGPSPSRRPGCPRPPAPRPAHCRRGLRLRLACWPERQPRAQKAELRGDEKLPTGRSSKFCSASASP